MTYLTYLEYSSMGGVLDSTAFNRNIDRACAMIDNRTQSRLECFEEIPQIVKVVCADLVDYIANNSVDYTEFLSWHKELKFVIIGILLTCRIITINTMLAIHTHAKDLMYCKAVSMNLQVTKTSRKHP